MVNGAAKTGDNGWPGSFSEKTEKSPPTQELCHFGILALVGLFFLLVCCGSLRKQTVSSFLGEEKKSSGLKLDCFHSGPPPPDTGSCTYTVFRVRTR